MKTMNAIAPGKLILSGEHAVVYGCPALAMAINAFSETHIRLNPLKEVYFHFVDLNLKLPTSFRKLLHLMQRVKEKHLDFLNDKCHVTEILQKPYELAQFAAISVLKHFQLILDKGLHISVSSSIPIGCGLGSSAATTISILKAIWQFFHLPENSKLLLKLALEAERLQHGYSSGLDLYVSYHGGCLRFHDGNVNTRVLPQTPMYLVHTGTPKSSTGACVKHAATFFKQDSLKRDFTAVTEHFDAAIQLQNVAEMQRAIRENHQLLTHIEVVPERVQHFIDRIEKAGGAAKICGAGAVQGDNAGAVLVLAEQAPQTLCDQFGYALLPVL